MTRDCQNPLQPQPPAHGRDGIGKCDVLFPGPGDRTLPALARQRLDEVLDEIDKTFTAVDSVVGEHLVAALQPSALAAQPQVLVRLAGPELPKRIERDRGQSGGQRSRSFS